MIFYSCSGRSSSRGFTLAEVISTIAIMSIIMIAVVSFQVSVLQNNRSSSVALTNTLEAQSLMKTIARELRSMEPGSNGAYPIAAAATNTITFFSDPDGDGIKDQIRYYLTNTTLYRGLIKPTGSPPTYNMANETTRTLVTGIRNASSTSLFEYYSSSYSGTSTPLTYPLVIPLVRLVRVNMTIDTDPSVSPLPRTFTTQASLRNLKDNL